MVDEESLIIGDNKCKCGFNLYRINSVLLYCEACDILYAYKKQHHYKLEKPIHLLNKRVFSINNRNKMFLKVGSVIEIDHLHVKVKFDEGQTIWLHHNNVRELFEEGL